MRLMKLKIERSTENLGEMFRSSNFPSLTYPENVYSHPVVAH